MAAHDEDDDLFADLYGDDEEDSKAPTQAPAPAAEPAPVPVPPVSIAAPTAGDASVGDVAAQLSAVTNKANDPRLAGQSNIPAPQPEPVPVPAPVSAPLPEMPQMPQMPTPAPPQPSYNVKEDGKMFIGGLNWETTDESLKEYFEQFGTVTDCMVMRDGATGRSRGFGFLTFAEASSVTTVVSKEHYLDGKIIDPKRAVPRDEQEKTAKMFVGGVPPDCDEDQFSQFFGQFGRVVDATLMMDKDTGRPRGFGFVTFDTGEAVERAMVTPFLQINGKTIEVKRATPKGNQDRNARGAGTYNPNGGLGASQESAAAYGGMTPAMMAQYYQRMQAWMAQMQAMGRGQAAQGMMGMNPMMNPMMMQQMQQMQQMQAQGGGGGQQALQGYGASPQQGGYGSQSPAQHGGGGYPSHQDGQYDDNAQDGNGGEGDNQDSRPPLDAPSGPSQYRAGRGGYNNGGGGGGYQDRGGRGYDNRGGGGRGGYQDRGRGRGRGGYRGGQSRFDPYSR